jgi:hypothetical protein
VERRSNLLEDAGHKSFVYPVREDGIMSIQNARFGVFTAMNIQVTIFWIMTPCSDVGGITTRRHNSEGRDSNVDKSNEFESG